MTEIDQEVDRFTIEDVVLYAFGLLVAVLMAYFMFTSQERLESGLTAFSESTRGQALRTTNPDLIANYLRYDYAATMLPSITARANISIMVGALLALMGSFLIVRGVRESPLTAEAATLARVQIKFAASSPGLVLALLGCVIIGITIWKAPQITVNEGSTTHSSETAVSDPGKGTRNAIGEYFKQQKEEATE